MLHEADPSSGLTGGDPSVDLSSNRTAMSFERTLMSADRTLMSALRTSLSLITFGFTIVQVFHQFARDSGRANATDVSARHFGLTLLLLGVGLLVTSLVSHAQLLAGLMQRRKRLHELGLLKSPPRYRPTATAVLAVLLLLAGVVATLDIIFHSGPFGG